MPSNPYRSAFSFGHNADTEDLLYPVDNPSFAFDTALKDVGYNPYAANPFTNSIRKLAPSLATAFQMEQSGNHNSNTPSAIARRGHGYANGLYSSMSFSDYLRGSITGEDIGNKKYNPPGSYSTPGWAPGSDYATTGTARGNIGTMAEWAPNAFRGVRQYREDLGAGRVNYQNLNPFMAQLSDQAGANGGLGTVDILSSLMTPLLGSSNMAAAYNRALRASGEQAIRRLADEGPGSQNDIWTYLLGI